METVPMTQWKRILAAVRIFWHEHRNVRRTVGALCIIVGLAALLTPLTPGSWLIPIGLEILGFRLLLWEKIKTRIMRINNFFKFIIAIVVSELAGVIGAVFTTSAIPTWYAGLAKPALNPPSWGFGPVWTTLFALIGVALFLVWRKDFQVTNPLFENTRRAWNPWSERLWRGDWQKFNTMAIFALQYILNIAWSLVFFGLHRPDAAFFVLIALWFSIVYLIFNFYRYSKLAAWLLVPYLLWVAFAGYLNYSIWTINAGESVVPEPVACTMEAKLCSDGSH